MIAGFNSVPSFEGEGLTRIALLSMSDTTCCRLQADGVGVDVRLSGQPARGQTLLNATATAIKAQCAECLPHRA
jgi:hypothetical protein